MAPMRGYDAGHGKSYTDLEGVACQIRKALKLPASKAEQFPGIPLFERLDRYQVHYANERIPLDYDVRNDLGDGIEAETRYDAKRKTIVIVLSDETYHALCREDGRARFSFAHELAHAFLHVGLLMRLARIPHHEMALLRGAPSHSTCFDTEWQADSCAAAMLMPAPNLLVLEQQTPGVLTASAVVEAFGVSFSAGEIRIENFEKRRRELLTAWS